MVKKAVSFEYASFIVDLLAQRVDKNDYNYIVGVGRGGLIPATLLAYKLNRKMLSFGISTYENDTQNENAFIYQDLPKFGDTPMKFLVVDDICDTGNTFNIIRKKYEMTPHTFEFASLFVRDSKSHLVDYYGLSVPEGIWVDFTGWEKL